MARRASWRSLRVRVALLTTLVACAAVASMTWYASRVSANAWRRQMMPTDPATLRGIADRVGSAVGAGVPDWQRGQPALLSGAEETGKQLIVFDSTRTAVAAAPIAILKLGATLGADGIVSMQRVVGDDERRTADDTKLPRAIIRQRMIVGSPRAVRIVRAPDAAPATLVEVSVPVSLEFGDPPIVTALRRSLLVGLAVAVIGSLLVAFVLSARVAAPIERLTRTARSLALGDRSAWTTTVPESGSAEVAELARAFNGMLGELERQESLRRGMTSDIAHELRTPLTNIRCQVESIIDGLESATPATLASLHEECLGLQQLVDDLQDMAYGDQGRLTIAVEPLDAATELALATRPFLQRASATGTTIDVAAPAGLSVVADRRRFRQIVGNLVSNALTYSSGGTVSISARGEVDLVVFEIRDNGSGIPAADLPNVFERFYRADPSRARAGGGAGLGLAIVKQLVELHRGTVSIDSAVGSGTVVRFALPRAQPAVGSDALALSESDLHRQAR